MTLGIIIGLLSGWLSLLGVQFIVVRQLAKRPPDFLVKAMAKGMGKMMAKQISGGKSRVGH